jgi:hypothetical protein
MKLKVALSGDLKAFLKEEKRKAKKAVTEGITKATYGLKQSMQKQVVTSGLGLRLAKSWRGDIYPKGKPSLNTAGIVYTKAEKIMQSFEYAKYIKSQKGLWLAIPTPNVPRRLLSKRINPRMLEKSLGVKLQFVYRSQGVSLLVANMRASYSRKTKEHVGFRVTNKLGKGASSVVMFWLVPQAKMPKLINFKQEAKRWHDKLPKLILESWVE